MKIVDYIGALPDSYKKLPNSNNYKLLLMESDLVKAFRDDIESVQETLDIYAAYGSTLDLYGKIYNQARGGMTDEQYRYVILNRAARCLVGGDANGIINALATVFGVPPSDFGLNETENPCEVEITSLPYTVLQNAGLTANQMYSLIAGMLPSGVKLLPLELSGTFEFSAYADEYDEEAGFGNIDQTIGGYFGYLATDNIDLPT